ncbi:MAG: CHAT domain-containing protein [Pyrinomonadaceae bacterium]|nr:CHAT domain-containing protein [Pyrinomonadaceae bacterium]
MAHAKRLLLRSILLGAFVCLCAGTVYLQSTEQEAQVRHLAERFIAAYQTKDLDAALSLWSKKSPDLEAARQGLQKAFTDYERIEIRSLRIVRVVVETERAETDLSFEMSAVDAKTGKPAAGLGSVNRTLVMVREGEEWKIWKEAASEEVLARELVDIKTEEKRKALLDTRKELATTELEKALSNLGRTFARQGRFGEALDAFGLALRLAEQLGDRRGVASLLHMTAVTHYYRGDFAQSLEADQKSLKIAEELGDQAMVADAINSIAIIYAVQGNNEQALLYFRRSLEVKGRLGDKAGVASNLNNIGGIYSTEGDFAQALEYYERSLKLADELGDKSRYAGTLNNIGQVFGLQGNHARALDYFQRSLKLKEELGEKVGIARALNNLGSTRASQGEYAEAVVYLQRSLKIKEEIEDKAGIAETLHNIAVLRYLQGDYEQSLEYNRRSLKLAEEMGYNHLIAYILQNMGDDYLRLAQYGQSVEFAERSSSLALSSDLANIYWRARTTAGKARLALGQREAARRDLQDAIAAIEKLRGQIAGGEQDLSLFFEDKVSPYQAMVDLLVAQNNPSEALSFAERAKGRALLDVLSGGRVSITKGMTSEEIKQERRLSAEISSLNLRLSRLKQQDKADEKEIADISGRLEKARLEYESFQTNLYLSHPELKVRRAETMIFTSDDARELLPDAQTALLEYVVSDSKVYLFVITGPPQARASSVNLTVYTLKVTGKELAELTESFRRRVAGRDLMIKRSARELYDLLIAPAEASLRGVTKLCLVPDASLWGLPFQALYRDGQGYLLERYAVFYAPSLSVLRAMKRQAAKLKATAGGEEILKARSAGTQRAARPGTRLELLALGNPALSDVTQAQAGPAPRSAALAALPDAEREVKTLGQLYGANNSKVLTGERAREELVKSEAGDYALLHFATHAVLDDSNPMYSYILLSHAAGAASEDGRLEVREIAELDLKAEMVVLSACQTARGRVAAGEGIVGMSWALFVAGSPTVVVTQWEVDAARSADLMIEFHRNLLQKRGMSKAEALRQSALKLLRGPYSHPAYWAGFILIGDER